MISVFSIDPGVTTGWAYIRNADLATLPASECDLDLMATQINGDENQQAKDLYRIINYSWPVAVVIEDFVPQKLNKDRWFLSPVRIAAKLELLLWEDNRRMFRQMPSLAMRTISDDYLRSAMLFNVGQPHANDAVRHGLTFLRTCLAHPELVEQLGTYQEL